MRHPVLAAALIALAALPAMAQHQYKWPAVKNEPARKAFYLPYVQAGTPTSMAARLVQRPSPESATWPENCSSASSFALT